ncbi:MAG: hypothetical protein QOH71_2461 [Blastocatellia bacterium]|jgi:hypothetical protein|nr:hypothetical protein [Blastocatellia bacterium]
MIANVNDISRDGIRLLPGDCIRGRQINRLLNISKAA